MASERLLLLFGASEHTLAYALDYLNIYILGTLFVAFGTGLVFFITAQGFTRISMISVLLGAGLNIVLDPIFIFLFRMGVKGAAVATVLSQACAACYVLAFLRGKRSILKLRRENLRIQRRLLFPALALGLSPCVMQITESILTVTFNRSLLRYGGDPAVGSMTIFSTLMLIAVYPLMGIGQGAQPIISYNHGAGRWDRVRNCSLLVLGVSVCYSVLLWGLIQLFPQVFLGILAGDAALRAYAGHSIQAFFSMLVGHGPPDCRAEPVPGAGERQDLSVHRPASQGVPADPAGPASAPYPPGARPSGFPRRADLRYRVGADRQHVVSCTI